MLPAEQTASDLAAILRDQTELDQIGADILRGGPRAVRRRENGVAGKSMVFVARHDDVADVLSDEQSFSVRHYDPLYAAIAPPGAFLIMRPEGPERAQRLEILRTAAAATPWFGSDAAPRRDLARGCVDNILAAVKRRRRFDLIAEYAYFAPYLIAKRVIGLSAPWSFSLLSLIVLVNGHSVSQLLAPETGPYLTDLVWSEVVLAQVLINFENRTWWMRAVARCGASQLRRQIERQIDTVPRAFGDQTLLNALWSVRDKFPAVEDKVYREHVVSITMELLTTLLLFPGQAFQGIIDRWLKPDGPGLEESLDVLRTMDAEDFVQEQLRFASPSGHLLRNATAPVRLGGLDVEPGEYVCALVKSAGTDVADPEKVIAGRAGDTYLHFGPEKGPHRCFGHLFAPSILAEMFLGLTRLPRLAPRTGLIGLGPVPGRMIVGFGEPVGTAP